MAGTADSVVRGPIGDTAIRSPAAPRHRKLRLLLGLLVAVTLLVAACGDDSGDGAGGEETEETDNGVGGETGKFDVVEADQQIAEAALLTLDDFGNGWVAGESSDEAEPVDVEALTGIEGCQSEAERVLEVGGQRTAFARSDFSRSADGAGVRVAPVLFVDEARAEEAFEFPTSDCNIKAIEQELEQSPEYSRVTVGQPESADFGDEAMVVRVEATLADPEPDMPMELILDQVTVRMGRGGATILFSQFVPADPLLVETDGVLVVETVVGRLAAELD